MAEIYKTRIISQGAEADTFLAGGMAITFGSGAPDTLAQYCFILAPAKLAAQVRPGQLLRVGERAYPITAVGEVASRNLSELGHVTLNFDGADSPQLDGTIHIRVDGPVPDMRPGVDFSIEDSSEEGK
ncbi:MAG: PTS glucitol/sorbitol transporter subunit IIA [Propionibacteriaceae bacterium]|jgi:PTS system glucitol/sorbitol-specific IIA component|nr:PTS glucitol/sorbitol transporter subunit IIA [Propionibacteriaceae bacterium]